MDLDLWDCFGRKNSVLLPKKYGNPFLTSGLVHAYNLDELISSFRGFCLMFLFLLHFLEKFLEASSVDPGKNWYYSKTS